MRDAERVRCFRASLRRVHIWRIKDAKEQAHGEEKSSAGRREARAAESSERVVRAARHSRPVLPAPMLLMRDALPCYALLCARKSCCRFDGARGIVR